MMCRHDVPARCSFTLKRLSDRVVVYVRDPDRNHRHLCVARLQHVGGLPGVFTYGASGNQRTDPVQLSAMYARGLEDVNVVALVVPLWRRKKACHPRRLNRGLVVRECHLHSMPHRTSCAWWTVPCRHIRRWTDGGLVEPSRHLSGT